MVTKVERAWGKDKLGNWNKHIHTTIYIIDNHKDLLYSTGKYIQYFVLSYKGKQPEKEYICMTEWILQT